MTARTAGYWLDDHDDDDAPGDGDALWERPQQVGNTRFVPRIGIGGAVRDTTLAFVAHLVAWGVSVGCAPLVITADTTDSGGWESATALRHMLVSVLDPAHIVGLVTDSTDSEGTLALLNAVATELLARYPDAHALLFVSSGPLAALPLNPTLAHYTVSICDVSYQTDTAIHPLIVAANLVVMHLPSSHIAARGERERGEIMAREGSLSAVVADCTSGQGLDRVFAVLWKDVLSE